MSANKRPAQKNKESELISFTVWLPREMFDRVNREALAQSSSRRLVNRSQVIRELIKKSLV